MRKVGILDKLNYKAGLLSDVDTTEEIATPEEQADIIANGAENIVPEEVAEAESLLNEIIVEDEMITEELAEVAEEQEVVAEGLQSDFTAVTTRNMIKSIERINARYGKDSIVTSGMQSDKHGGHKALYVAGLQAKENFLKEAGKSIWALIQSMIQKIKEVAKKVSIFLNNDKKSAEKLLKIIKGKTDKFKDGVTAELSEKEIESVGSKFGAWLSIDGKLESYPADMKKFLLTPVETVVNSEDDSVEVKDNAASMTTKFKINKDVKAVDGNVVALSCVGKNLKYVIEGEGGPSVGTTLVSEDDYKAKIKKEVPSLSTLESHAKTAAELAGELDKYAKATFAALDVMSKLVKDGGKSAGESYSNIKKAVMIQNQIAMAQLTAYTSTQKSMIWFAGAFVNKYSGGTDATAEDKKTSEAK